MRLFSKILVDIGDIDRSVHTVHLFDKEEEGSVADLTETRIEHFLTY